MIDWAKVGELRDEIGVEDFTDVVELFLQEVDEAIAGLGAATASTPLEAQLHFLKGSALNLGFRSFAQMCLEGESVASSGDASGVDVPAILACYNASREVFLAELDARLAA
jgi:HPt (histidine-containing phosphotransfer) domain-containing protein